MVIESTTKFNALSFDLATYAKPESLAANLLPVVAQAAALQLPPFNLSQRTAPETNPMVRANSAIEALLRTP